MAGIDLGTTNSVISYWDRDRPRVYKPYHDSFLLPSAVFKEPEGSWVVGRVAQRNRALHPSRVFRSLKRHMWDPEFRATIDGIEYTPAQLSAQILAKLQEIAQAAVPTSHLVRAAISVPYGFKHYERSQTLQAAKYANLCPQDATHLINEPTAAALAYGLDRAVAEKAETVLVFDLGGGTFDITIFQVYQEGQTLVVEVLGVGGDPELGGDDFDRIIADHALAHFQKETGIDLRTDTTHFRDEQERRLALSKVEEAARLAKEELSTTDDTDFLAEHLVPGKHLFFPISRGQLQLLVQPLLNRLRDITRLTVSEAVGLSSEREVDKVLLMGGSTKMPFIRDLIRDLFGRPPFGNVDVSTGVSEGATIYAAMRAGLLARDVRIEDVVSHAIGVKVKGQDGFRVYEFIRKNAKTPLGVSNFITTERDRATEFDLEIYQGNSRVVEECTLVGAVRISGLAPLPRAQQKIELRLHSDRDGLIHVTVTDHTSGQRQEHTVQPQ